MKRNSNFNEPEFKRGLTEDEINSPEFNPDDFAPAPDKTQHQHVNESLENKRNSLAFSFIIAFFAVIIGIVGWASSFAVNAYYEGLTEKKVLSAFENCDRVEPYNTSDEEHKVYAVFFKNRMAGYCVLKTVEGFGGDIELVVAFNSDNVISGVKVLDHNESRGLGSLVAGEDFLSQFYGRLVGNISEEYDLIAGATTSSKAVGEAVKEILGLGLSTDSIAKELGYDTITEDEIEEEVKKEEDNSSSDTDEKTDTTDKDGPGVGDFQGGSNVNNGDGDMDHSGEDITTEYDTETESPEDDTTEEDTTDEPENTTGPDKDTDTPQDSTTAPETDPVVDTNAPTDDTSSPDTSSDDTTSSDTSSDTTVPVQEDTTDAEPVEQQGVGGNG